MQASMNMQTLVSQRPTARPSRSALVVRASAEDTSSRRAAMGAVLAGAVALFASNSAEAKVKNPAQDSIKRGGSSTEASMSSFNMEGIKKRGLKAGQKKDLMAEAKAKAKELAAKVPGN